MHAVILVSVDILCTSVDRTALQIIDSPSLRPIALLLRSWLRKVTKDFPIPSLLSALVIALRSILLKAPNRLQAALQATEHEGIVCSSFSLCVSPKDEI